MDHVLRLPHFPECDTKVKVLSDWQQVGGPVPTALATAAFYGTQVCLQSRWGQDAAGNFITRSLQQRGVRVCEVQAAPDWSTGFAHVWLDSDGNRTIAYSRGNFALPTASDLAVAKLRDCSILHLDGWADNLAIAAAKQMQRQGGTVVLDGGSRKPGTETLLPLADVLIASRLFRHSYLGDADANPARLLESGCQAVIATDGAAGARLLTSAGTTTHPAPAVTAVDTNGAGDIFCGAILHGLASGRPLPDCVSFACAVAASSCRHEGNFTLPTFQEAVALGSRSL